MRKWTCALGALMFVGGAQQALAVTDSVINPAAYDPTPTVGAVNDPVEIRDAGPGVGLNGSAGGVPGNVVWVNQRNPKSGTVGSGVPNGGTGDTDIYPTRYFQSDGGNGGGSYKGPNPLFNTDALGNFRGSANASGQPFTNQVELFMATGDYGGNTAKQAEYQEYDANVGGFGGTESLKATFRAQHYNNNNGGTSTNALGSPTNHGDGILGLNLSGAPGIGIEVKNSLDPASGRDVYSFIIDKFHRSGGSVQPLQIVDTFVPDGLGGTKNYSAQHTAEIKINAATDLVQVLWDNVLVFNQVVAPWTTGGGDNGGVPYYDAGNGTATFAARMTSINSGNGNSENIGFQNVTLAQVPEPSTIVLIGMGLVGFLGFARKRRQK